jgi:deoxyribonuclease V
MLGFHGRETARLIAEARAVQVRMHDRCGCGQGGAPSGIRIIGGADAAYAGAIGIGAVALFTLPELEPVEYAVALRQVLFPYIPGLFAFREIPLCLAACEKLSLQPDLLIFNGHGYAHPKRFGMACHAGALLKIPTIGVTSRPCAGSSMNPDTSRGSCTPLEDGTEEIGMAVRTRKGSAPVYVSAGYLTDRDLAIEITLATARDTRMPIPLHAADLIARNCMRNRISI